MVENDFMAFKNKLFDRYLSNNYTYEKDIEDEHIDEMYDKLMNKLGLDKNKLDK